MGNDAFELLRDAAGEAHTEEIESVLEPLRERFLQRCQGGPPVSAFRLQSSWTQVLDRIEGERTLGALVAQHSVGGQDLEPVYRALYLGLACGLVQARVQDGAPFHP